MCRTLEPRAAATSAEVIASGPVRSVPCRDIQPDPGAWRLLQIPDPDFLIDQPGTGCEPIAQAAGIRGLLITALHDEAPNFCSLNYRLEADTPTVKDLIVLIT
jgi:hypothetical protein